MRVSRVGWCLTGSALLAACSGGDGKRGGDVLSSSLWAVEGPIVRVGAIDDPEYAFGSVRSLVVAPDGVVYSMHFREAAIRRWTPDGLPSGSVGREGEGPGEFMSPYKMGFFGDSLWVFDLDGYRVSYFDRAGAFLGSVMPRVDIGSAEDAFTSPPRPETPLRDGTFVGEAPAWSQEIVSGQLTETPVVHMDAQGMTLALIWTRPHRSTDVLGLLREDGRGGTFAPQPFGDAPLMATIEAGVLLVDRLAHQRDRGATFSITRIGRTGDTIWHRAIPYTPEPLPRARVDSAVRAHAQRLHSFMSRRDPGLALGALERRVRDAMHGPEYLPPITDMVVAADGAIWLARSGGREGGVEWWVFDRSGSLFARALTPPGLRVHVVSGEVVWGVETDDFDVNYIVRYRLVTDT